MALVCFGGTNRHCGSALWLPETYHPQAMALVCFGGTAQHRGSSSRLSIAAAVEMRKATVAQRCSLHKAVSIGLP